MEETRGSATLLSGFEEQNILPNIFRENFKQLCIFVQDYVEKAEQVYCPALLLEGPADALLMEMLVPAPYKVPEQKAKKKAPVTRSGLRRNGTSDVTSEYAETHSSTKDDDEEEVEEEFHPPLLGGERCHAQYATLSKRNSKVPPRIDPHIETLLQGGYHYINIT